MISSQGKKQLSLTMQIWNWNGKKRAVRTQDWVNVPFLTWVFHDLCVWDQVWNVPGEALGSYRCFLFFYFDDIQAKGFFSDCLPFKKNLQFPFRLFRNSAFHPFNKSVMSWTESRSGARCKNNSSVLWIMVIYTRHHTLSFPLKSFLLLNAAAEATLNFLKFTQLSKFTQRRS